MTAVWVLSEESPSTESEPAGWAVCGVFATPEAALFFLGAELLDSGALTDLTWDTTHPGYYEGRGHGHDVYTLAQWNVWDLAVLRKEFIAEHQHASIPLPPLARLSTADLLATLGPIPASNESGADGH